VEIRKIIENTGTRIPLNAGIESGGGDSFLTIRFFGAKKKKDPVMVPAPGLQKF